ncbi:lysine-rich arabinogalactan protein 19-like [Photinus pyralis]|uniref:lysine-rich arabinogalactan protein 19-like n=1 Tax=Photinus pyralis TaxID=7054 RepID=UPI00126735B8|nr:lysine-rich arabinogalactan protein 19-like [Photinus pyralis]XP_031344388.1 lysine-rich arabinogalactan protein 19-like [Photinus pyralis]
MLLYSFLCIAAAVHFNTAHSQHYDDEDDYFSSEIGLYNTNQRENSRPPATSFQSSAPTLQVPQPTNPNANVNTRVSSPPLQKLPPGITIVSNQQNRVPNLSSNAAFPPSNPPIQQNSGQNIGNIPPVRNPPVQQNRRPNPNDGGGAPMREPPIISSTTQFPFTTTAPPAFRRCIQTCGVTAEYSPVCGTNRVTYNNMSRFRCAQYCGLIVELSNIGRCP